MVQPGALVLYYLVTPPLQIAYTSVTLRIFVVFPASYSSKDTRASHRAFAEESTVGGHRGRKAS